MSKNNSNKRRQQRVREAKDYHPSSSAKPKRKSATNPNWMVGEPIYPVTPGEFYIFGQSVNKMRDERSESIGPYPWIRIVGDFVYANNKNVAYKEGRTQLWILDGNPKGYYEIVILASGAEVPPTNGSL